MNLDESEENSTMFKEYNTFLSHYSKPNQLQSSQFKKIIDSKIPNDALNVNFSNLEEASKTRLNPNVPVYKKSSTIYVDGKPVEAFKQFWQYKQNGGSIFTNYVSSGVSSIYEDIAVRNLPLRTMGLENPTPELVLSNSNNVRNNLQNYGKTYLTTTNLLNSEAFHNGLIYSHASSPYRTGGISEEDIIEHGTFGDKTKGDEYSRNIEQMRVDLPSNYAQTLMTTWQTINPICIKPDLNPNLTEAKKLQYGTFNLDALLYIGQPCLTKDFNIIPSGFDKSIDVFNDDSDYPPLQNINYYKKGNDFMKKVGVSDGLYCSPNSNYISVPINYKYPNLDTSINFSPGNNSIPLGMIMQPILKDFINKDLYNLNKLQILRALYSQFKNNPEALKNLRRKYKEIGQDKMNYSSLNENEKYNNILNIQKELHEKHIEHPQTKHFITSLSIVKLGGDESNAKVLLDSVQYLIFSPGVFLLLPSMLGDDLFDIKKDTVSNCTGSSDELRGVNCCFKGPPEAWAPDSQYYPSYDLNIGNSLVNMVNPGCGINPYNAPSTF